jgi:quinol monooxygenase YgiN
MSMKNEKYKSMGAMKKHEKTEGKKEMMMEYGKLKKKPAVKKPSVKKKK